MQPTTASGRRNRLSAAGRGSGYLARAEAPALTSAITSAMDRSPSFGFHRCFGFVEEPAQRMLDIAPDQTVEARCLMVHREERFILHRPKHLAQRDHFRLTHEMPPTAGAWLDRTIPASRRAPRIRRTTTGLVVTLSAARSEVSGVSAHCSRPIARSVRRCTATVKRLLITGLSYL